MRFLKKPAFLLALSALLCLAACSSPSIGSVSGASSAPSEPVATAVPSTAQTPTPTLEPTPEPTPTPTPPLPVSEDGTFSLYGLDFNLRDAYLNLSHTPIDDNGDALVSMLPFCTSLEAVDLDSCGLSNERCAEIRDEFPEIEVIWRVNFGDNYSVRTNVTKILASMPGTGGMLYDDSVAVLKYCTKVRYLDLGHNDDITDFSFVESMPDLEIAVISMTHPSTLEPFASCQNLLYLEAGNCALTDISPLAACKNLKHLNLGTNTGVSDISSLYDLNLLRLYLGTPESTSVPSEQMDEYERLHPDCVVNRTVTPWGEAYVLEDWKCWQQWNSDDWTYYDNNGSFPVMRPIGYWKVAYKAFEYIKGGQAYAFSWNDPRYSERSDAEPVNTFIINTSQLSEKWDLPDYNNMDSFVPVVYDDPPGEIISVGKY